MAEGGHQEWLDPHKTEAAQKLAVERSRHRLNLFHTWTGYLESVTLRELVLVVEQKRMLD